jgi:hypothetical protein
MVQSTGAGGRLQLTTSYRQNTTAAVVTVLFSIKKPLRMDQYQKIVGKWKYFHISNEHELIKFAVNFI